MVPVGDSLHCCALPSQTVVLVGDIGGTNCRLVLERIVNGQSDEVLFQKVQPASKQLDALAPPATGRNAAAGSQPLQPIPQVYPTAEYDTFEDALDALYAEEVMQRHPPQSAALAVAGPVISNCCKMTNLKWVIDGQELTQRRGIL